MAVPTWYNIGVSEQFSIAYKSLIEIVLWENFLWQFRLVWNTINNFTQNKLISILLSFPVSVLQLSGGSKESKFSPSFESSHGHRGKNQQHRSNTLFNIFVYCVVLGFLVLKLLSSWFFLWRAIQPCQGKMFRPRFSSAKRSVGRGSSAWEAAPQGRSLRKIFSNESFVQTYL